MVTQHMEAQWIYVQRFPDVLAFQSNVQVLLLLQNILVEWQ